MEEKSYMKKLTLEDIESWNDDRKRGRFFNCLSGIKSGVLVGTANSQKKSNLAIFTSLFHLGANPALMGIVIRPDISPRHTLLNIKEVGYYTLNLLPYDFHQNGHQTSARYPENISEFGACGFTEEWSELVPYVKESQIKWLMKLVKVVDIPENNTHIVIGEVKEIQIPEVLISDDGAVDIAGSDPALVTGLDCYHQVKPGKRYAYAKPDKETKEL